MTDARDTRIWWILPHLWYRDTLSPRMEYIQKR